MNTHQSHERTRPRRSASLFGSIVGFLCIVCGINVTLAQEKKLDFTKVEIPNSHVDFHSAVEDDNGFIWFGSFNGLYRYNGLTFKVFSSDPSDSTSLTHGRPLYVVKGRENDLWVGTNTGGISRLDLNTYRFDSYRHTINDTNSIGGNDIGGLLVDADGVVWAGSDNYCLSRLDWQENSVQRMYPEVAEADLEFKKYSNYLGAIVQDPGDSDVLWIGAPFGVYRFYKETHQFELFRFPTKLNLYKPVPLSLCADDEGIIWAGSVNGIMRIDPHSGQMNMIILEPNGNREKTLGEWRATAIRNFSDHEIMVMTHFDGLYIYNTITGDVDIVNDDESLGRGSNVYLKDQLGNIWIESNSALWRHAPSTSRLGQLDLSHLPGTNWSRSILNGGHQNSFYIGTYSGAGLLYVDFDRSQITNYSYQFSSVNEGDVFMRDLGWHEDSMIYIASDGGLLQFNPENKLFRRIEDDTGAFGWNNITALCSCNGDVWFASEDEGLFSIKLNSDAHVLSNHLTFDLRIQDMLCQGNSLWLGTSSGLNKVDFDGTPEFQSIITDIDISQLMLFNDTLWLSTSGQGLFRLDTRNPTVHQQFVNRFDGSTNLIYAFTRADNGVFWLNTDGGTVSLKPGTHEYVKYPVMGVGRRSPIMQLSNGTMVSGGYKKIMHFNPGEINDRGISPTMYITKIDIANRKESFELAPDRINHILLQPNERELTIEFDAINFNNISITDFVYRIDGLTDGWQHIGPQRYLNINNPPRENYTLELKAVNAFGGESNSIKRISITALPPVYRQFWFQLIAIIVVISMSIIVYLQLQKRKRKRLQNEQREHELLAFQKEIAELKLTALQSQMNPHFIFNSLNSINWYILKNKPAEASIYLTKFSKLVRRILDNSKTLSIPLDSEINALRLYLDLETMRFKGTFTYEIQTDEEIDLEEVLVPPLILQPFVENSIWHGLTPKEGMGNLLIQIYPENGNLKCIVQDDGIGRRASHRMKSNDTSGHKSKGFKLTTDRIKLAHKDFQIENAIRVIDLVDSDGCPAGTRVEVLLPYD